MPDMVNHPPHYKQYDHEVIELTSKLDFCTGNAVKYILRSRFKGKEKEDLEKSKWYMKYLKGMQEPPYNEYDCEDRRTILRLSRSFGNYTVNEIVKLALCNPCDRTDEEFDSIVCGIQARIDNVG